MIKATDKRIKALQAIEEEEQHRRAEEKAEMQLSRQRQYPSHMFFSYNTSLGPPYHVLLDTNFRIAVRIARDPRMQRLTCSTREPTPMTALSTASTSTNATLWAPAIRSSRAAFAKSQVCP